MNTSTHVPDRRRLAFALALALSTPLLQAAETRSLAGGVQLLPEHAAAAYQVRVTGPAGYLFEHTFLSNESLLIPVGTAGWADGGYRYEIAPVTGSQVRQNDELAVSAPAQIEAGSFRVEAGTLYLSSTDAEGSRPRSTRDQVIPDDLIVQGSTCVGLDCVNNENFGFDTIRLKENNTRIKFEDTSVAPFPSTDWQLTANDSASGGQNRLSIEDVTAATIPFTVTGAAPNDSLFIGSSGRIGLRTSTPVLELHINDSDTPSIRLEQNSSGGFTAQTWDIAGNEANFFVRDVTGGSRLPLRIRPGAPTSSIDINNIGNVGIGTASPASRLHVAGSDGNAALLVRETNATAVGRDMMRLENNGPTRFRMLNTATANEWSINAHNSDFRITPAGAVIVAMTIFPNGNVTIAGTLTQNSDRASKENFRNVDHKQLLDRIAALEISEWNFKSEGDAVRHIGPMAQDFHAAFGLGAQPDRIAPLDTSGVALAAIQGLQHELADRDQRIAALEAQVQRLDAATRQLADLQRRIDHVLAATPAACPAEPIRVGL